MPLLPPPPIAPVNYRRLNPKWGAGKVTTWSGEGSPWWVGPPDKGRANLINTITGKARSNDRCFWLALPNATVRYLDGPLNDYEYHDLNLYLGGGK